jgi:hypothetical protein
MTEQEWAAERATVIDEKVVEEPLGIPQASQERLKAKEPQ